MVITVIALLALIIFIIVGVMARKNQEDKKHMIEHQILQLTKFKGELMSHHTLEDTFKIHRQLGAMHLAWNPAICPAQYGMFRTSNIATMSMDDVFLGDICGLWTHTLTYWLTCNDAVIIVTGQYYEQVLNGIKAEIRELKKKINSL